MDDDALNDAIRRHPASRARRERCGYSDCDAPVTHYAIGGTFGTVKKCHFHAIECVICGYATRITPVKPTQVG